MTKEHLLKVIGYEVLGMFIIIMTMAFAKEQIIDLLGHEQFVCIYAAFSIVFSVGLVLWIHLIRESDEKSAACLEMRYHESADRHPDLVSLLAKADRGALRRQAGRAPHETARAVVRRRRFLEAFVS